MDVTRAKNMAQIRIFTIMFMKGTYGLCGDQE